MTLINPSKLGLGCSRLGSTLSGKKAQAVALLTAAQENGINVFDTANIYGQGDSERILGNYFNGTNNVFFITKVGQKFPLYLTLLKPLKRAIQGLAETNNKLKLQIHNRRSRPVRFDFSASHIRSGLDASLRRLRRDAVDVLLLHSPTADIIQRGEAIETLLTLKRLGKVGLVGTSCDDLECAFAVVKDLRMDAIQIPLSVWNSDFVPVAVAARARGMFVIAREILGGVQPTSAPIRSPIEVQQAVSAIMNDSHVDIALIGTTKPDHLIMLVGGS